MKKYSFILLLLGCGIVFGDEPRSVPSETLEAPAAFPSEAPTLPPAVKPALSVQLLAPADAIRGDLISFQMVTTGDVSSSKWLVSPAVPGLVVLDGGRSAVFATRNLGTYRVIVAIAGDGGVDVAEHEVEILDGQSTVAKGSPSAANAKADADECEPAPLLDLESQLVKLVNEVPSRARVAEAKIIGGCFRTTANRIETGLFPSGQDPLADVQRQVVLALGNATPPWQGFLIFAHEYLDGLRHEGLAITPATMAPVLAEWASILARLQ